MDKKSQLTYRMIEAAVNKGIKYIEENGNRGVRNIVDLGAHFAKGRFQQEFFKIAQQILNDENSMYYTFAKDLVKNVEHDLIKTFGINLGYCSWTYGAKKIRNNEKKLGYNIPWTMVFKFDESIPLLSSDEISNILMHAEALGIYCSKFFVGNNASFLTELLPELYQHKNSVYFLFVEPQIITNNLIDNIISAGNIAIVLLNQSLKSNIKLMQTSERLFNKKCLYGIYNEYNNKNVELIMNNDYIQQIQNTGSSFIYLIKKQRLTNENQEHFSSFIKKIKNKNPYPIYFVDFYQDIAYVDQIISVEDCFMSINSDGSITVSEKNELKQKNLNIKNESLEAILNKVMPKINYV